MRVTPALLLFVAMVALAISLPGNAAPEGRSASPTEGPLDELGRRLFLGLQTGDSAVVRELLAEREDLDATLDVLEKRFADSPEMLEELAEGREEIEEMFGAERIAKFQAKREENVRTTLAARDWSAARLLGIEYEVELGDFGIREAEVDLVMEVAGSGVRVRADDLIETPHGWRSVEDRPLRVRVEED